MYQTEKEVVMPKASLTLRTRKRYNRLAPYYDLLEAPIESLRFARWRARLRVKICGPKALEVGVGTGKNMDFYPSGVNLTGIDLSPRMLDKARKRAATLGLEVGLKEMDVEELGFPDQSFDTVFATFVFCSVPDPVLGLKELRRVCKSDGRLLLLEHMQPANPFLGLIFDALNPLVVRMMGANINRRNIESIRQAGWNVELEENLFSDIVRWVEARPRIHA
jgi:ubiquinone/menaquinone biosynthesis C-methylase UbiE